MSHPTATVGVMGEGWNPWRALRSRGHLTFARLPLPDATGGAVFCQRGDRGFIIVDPSLSQVERRAALTHELIHDEFGSPISDPSMPEAWDIVVLRDESAIENEVARRLVPQGELAALLATLEDMGHSPDLWEIAEEFGVPEHVAERAITLLGRSGFGERSAG